MKKLFLFLLLTVLGFSAFSQGETRSSSKQIRKEEKRKKINDLIKQSEEGVLVFNKQSIFGIQLRTNGYGLLYEIGRMKTPRKTTIYRIDFTELKSAKEEKQTKANSNFLGNPYVYGKINYFYPLTLGIGQQYVLGQKGNKNGVSVTAIYSAGLSIGLLRPYYVDVEETQGSQLRSIKYSPEDSALFLDANKVISGGSLAKGWGQIKIKPGAFAKIGMRFDYGRFNETVSALEIGMNIDFYATKIPIMALQKDKQLFMQAYVAILFGRRK